MKHTISILFSFLLLHSISAQNEFKAGFIPKELAENANAVVRSQTIDIVIQSRRSLKITTERIITIFNEHGLKHMEASEYYDKSRKINTLEAVIYDAYGKEIKKVKKKDFRDISVADGFSIYTDNRIMYLDYTPVQYPFTIVYRSETESSNTAFIPSWYPVTGYYVGVEKTTVKVRYPLDLGFKFKKYNFEGFDIAQKESQGFLEMILEKVPAIKREEYSPPSNIFYPYLLMGLDVFHLEGVDGKAESWEQFGLWVYSHLLSGTDELSAATIEKIKELVGDEKDPVKISRIVFEYVQSKTRYVSIQMGIGGWKPMQAKDVDRLGYGDCKALANYTRILLSVVGIPSYYTIVYLDSNKRDLREDFVSMQGNHAILAIPIGDEIKWVECTSQTVPFDFQANATDDRMALLVTPTGGKLVRTKKYLSEDNSQITQGRFKVFEDGSIEANVEMISTGGQYNRKEFLDRMSHRDRVEFYKKYFDVNAIGIDNIHIQNDREQITLTEKVEMHARQYVLKSGDRLMIPLNLFNKNSKVPSRYRTRTNPFQLARGYFDSDAVEILLPEGYIVEAIPDRVSIQTEFGIYIVSVEIKDENTLMYMREMKLYEGVFKPEEYEKFRSFMEQVVKNDNAKAILKKKV